MCDVIRVGGFDLILVKQKTLRSCLTACCSCEGTAKKSACGDHLSAELQARVPLATQLQAAVPVAARVHSSLFLFRQGATHSTPLLANSARVVRRGANAPPLLGQTHAGTLIGTAAG